MAHTRQYRTGMGNDRAIAILQAHAGSRWDPVVVDVLIELLAGTQRASDSLDMVGRSETGDVEMFCGCADAVPFELSAKTPVASSVLQPSATAN